MRIKNLKHSRRLTVLSIIALFAFAASAQATVIHGDYFGTNVDFLGLQETSSFGDPEPLFGAPIISGNQLLFFPPNFNANAAGAGGIDQTGAQLQTTIMGASALDTIDTIVINEFGDNLLTGVGTAATGTFVSMSGFVTVLETIGGPIAPVVIPFTGTFTQDLFLLPGDLGTKIWSGGATIDVASVVADATKVMLSLDNDLVASSEAGTTSKIQKKVVSGPAVTVEVIPEPTTALLVGAGLAALGMRRRRTV